LPAVPATLTKGQPPPLIVDLYGAEYGWITIVAVPSLKTVTGTYIVAFI